jgi:hypothetical protein
LLGNCKRDEGLAQPIKFVTENKDAGSASAPQVEGAGKTVKIKGFTVSHYKNSILLKGDTKPLKEDLKSMNGIWFSPQNAWMFAKIRKEELVDFLSQL